MIPSYLKPSRLNPSRLALRRLATCCLLALAATGCVRSDAPQYPTLDEIPMEIPPATADLNAWQVPPRLGPFEFQGEVQFGDQPLRILRYSASDGTLLDLTLFPFPGGWDSMTPSRAVAGQYGQQRQTIIERALRHGAQEVQPVQETLTSDTALAYPVASGRLVQHYSTRNLVTLLALTAVQPVFLSASTSVSPDQADGLADAVLQGLITFAEANTSASEHVPQQ